MTLSAKHLSSSDVADMLRGGMGIEDVKVRFGLSWLTLNSLISAAAGVDMKPYRRLSAKAVQRHGSAACQ